MKRVKETIKTYKVFTLGGLLKQAKISGPDATKAAEHPSDHLLTKIYPRLKTVMPFYIALCSNFAIAAESKDMDKFDSLVEKYKDQLKMKSINLFKGEPQHLLKAWHAMKELDTHIDECCARFSESSDAVEESTEIVLGGQKEMDTKEPISEVFEPQETSKVEPEKAEVKEESAPKDHSTRKKEFLSGESDAPYAIRTSDLTEQQKQPDGQT